MRSKTVDLSSQSEGKDRESKACFRLSSGREVKLEVFHMQLSDLGWLCSSRS